MGTTTRWPAPARIPLAWQVASLLLPLCMLAGLGWRLTVAKPPAPLDARTVGNDERFGLTLVQRKAIYADIAGHDKEWRDLAARFEDTWSQHDDYHIHVSRHIQNIAAARKLPLQAVFLIYDEGLRRHWTDADGRWLEATWVPLRPRTH
ncbi:MAG: hypothetical protein HY902_08870 [Deltaproteobacteria bacterium]|nr:hypothetical protein [Deltaproteobacteria bacterium]